MSNWIVQNDTSTGMNKAIQGASHVPEITGDFVAGVPAPFDTDYSQSPAGWLPHHAICFRDGKRTLFTQVSTEWPLFSGVKRSMVRGRKKTSGCPE